MYHIPYSQHSSFFSDVCWSPSHRYIIILCCMITDYVIATVLGKLSDTIQPIFLGCSITRDYNYG